MESQRTPPATPQLELITGESNRAVLRGEWTLRRLSPVNSPLRRSLLKANENTRWDLSGVSRLDSFGATLLWRAWGGRWPANLNAPDACRVVLEHSARAATLKLPKPPAYRFGDAIAALGARVFGFADHLVAFIRLVGQLCLDFVYLLVHPGDWPLREISANVFKVGVKAMPVAALVGFLIGVVLSYLSALQLKAYGADIFIVDILGMGIIRELGPVLVSVLVAGRSGSAMTAQIGVMRVTEELDALAALGISRTQRLVLPKVLALAFSMPLLVLWTSASALLGGMLSAWLQLDLSIGFFIETLPRAVPLPNVFIGLAKGAAFGLLIALVACHFGLRIKPNTESLSANTTASVVTAITLVILVDAIFAIATRTIGVPG